MPKQRKNDPQGVSARNIATDPVRLSELTAEYERKLAFVRRHYELAMKLFEEGPSFNDSLRALKRWYATPNASTPKPKRHPEIGFAAWYLSRSEVEAAGADRLRVTAAFKEGEREAVRRLKPRRGRRKDDQLRHHVEGMMALIQEASGVAVHATRYKNDDYAPQASDAQSQSVIKFFRQINPRLTVTQIVNIILDARKRHRGKPMRFRDYFPNYGVRVTLV